MQQSFTINVCLAPPLFPYFKNTGAIVIIVDILRATTSICAAIMNGAKEIIPVGSEDELKEYQSKGFLIAGERDGKTLCFADIGNSPHYFTPGIVKGKTIAYSTTNGTRIVEMAKDCHMLIAGSFYHLQPLADMLSRANHDVIIFCAGWKNKFNLEDTLFAGALTTRLLSKGSHRTNCDSAIAAADLWKQAEADVPAYLEKSAWIKRLKLYDVMHECLRTNITNCIPVFNNGSFKINTEINH